MPHHRDLSAYLLAGLLAGSGVLHFTASKPYESIVPQRLGNARRWVQLSGAAELALAAAVTARRSRRKGALGAATLFVAVFPANVQMALDSGRGRRTLAGNPLIAWGRLPLQAPLVAWALDVAKKSPPRGH